MADPTPMPPADPNDPTGRYIQVKLAHALMVLAALSALLTAAGPVVDQLFTDIDAIQKHLHANDMRLDRAGAPPAQSTVTLP